MTTKMCGLKCFGAGSTARWAVLLGALIALCPTAQAQYLYETNNGTLTITKYTGSDAKVIVPALIDGLAVTAIGDNAFGFKVGVQSVALPNSITSIAGSAFYFCLGLTNITIQNGVTNLGGNAFFNCRELKSIHIPQSLKQIGDDAFFLCATLSVIDVDPLNSVYGSVDGILFNKSKTVLIYYPGGKSGAYSVPNGVTNLFTHAFYGSGVTEVTMGNGVTAIGDSAFGGCESLTSVKLPGGLKVIPNELFVSCFALTNMVLPDSVVSIGDYAFYHCSNLTSVVIPKGLTNIGAKSFSACASLSSVTIPKGVEAILEQTFQNCTNVTAFYFSGNAPSVAALAFGGDSKATMYYTAGTKGWTATLAGWPTAVWNPTMVTGDSIFGISANGFGFTIKGTQGPVVVEASTSLVGSVWTPMATNSMVGGTAVFQDAAWSGKTMRFYRLRSP